MNSRTSNRRIKETTTKRETKPEEKQAKTNKQSIKDKQEPKLWIVYKVFSNRGQRGLRHRPALQVNFKASQRVPVVLYTIFLLANRGRCGLRHRPALQVNF
jgi:hypothetical protein